MEAKLRNLALLFTGFLITACSQKIDFSGFFYSTDKIETRFAQSANWNKTHPFKQLSVGTDAYQLLVAGDSHIGPLQNFRKFVSEAQKPENTAMIIVGDVVSGKAQDYVALKENLPDFNATPYFMLVGNHDIYFDGWKSFYKDYGTSTYLFFVKTPSATDIYICLDSGSGTLGPSQLSWLKEVLLTQRPQCRNCIVFSHVNFFRNRHTGSTNPLVEELYVLMDLFAKNNVQFIISGHDHVQSINEFGNTTYITMDGLLDTLPTASFMKLKVKSNQIQYEFVKLSSLN